MLVAGDEIGRTQRGNNNAYCQDTETYWLDWDLVRTNADLLRFTSRLIAFRRAHPVLRSREHLVGVDRVGSGYPDISWHGFRAWQPNWMHHGRILALLRCGRHAGGGLEPDDSVYVAMNAHDEPQDLELPDPPHGTRWAVALDTAAEPPFDAFVPGREPPLTHPGRWLLAGHGVVVLVSQAPSEPSAAY
jgi:glycogen operon protein